MPRKPGLSQDIDKLVDRGALSREGASMLRSTMGVQDAAQEAPQPMYQPVDGAGDTATGHVVMDEEGRSYYTPRVGPLAGERIQIDSGPRRCAFADAQQYEMQAAGAPMQPPVMPVGGLPAMPPAMPPGGAPAVPPAPSPAVQRIAGMVGPAPLGGAQPLPPGIGAGIQPPMAPAMPVMPRGQIPGVGGPAAPLRQLPMQAPEPISAAPMPRRRPRPRSNPQPRSKWQDPEYLGDLSTRLADKALYGSGVPAKGVIPAGSVPSRFRGVVQSTSEKPLIGWDMKDLDPDEQMMLALLMQAESRQRGEGENPATGGVRQ